MSELLVFDPTVESVDVLMAGLNDGVAIVPVDVAVEPAAVLAQAFARQGVTTLHLLAHGQPGAIRFHDTLIDRSYWETRVVPALGSQASRLPGIREINIWSCRTGEGEVGMKFLELVSESTQANVNASAGLVGDHRQGGTWELERRVMAKPPFSVDAMGKFDRVLTTQIFARSQVIDGKEIWFLGIPSGASVRIEADGVPVTIVQNSHK